MEKTNTLHVEKLLRKNYSVEQIADVLDMDWKYVEENKIDQIVVLYSFGNYIEDENQFLLAY